MNPMSDIFQSKSIFSNCIINSDKKDFLQKYNRSPFMFSHNLAGNPLFEIPRLAELASTLSSNDKYRKPRCHVANVPVDHKWADAQLRDQISEAISNIVESNAWVLLYSVQVDPDYAKLLDQIINELETLVGMPLRQEITWLDAYIFIASPHAVTHYHIDHEATFLFQIQGEREANIFSPSDRQILSAPEIESYFQGNLDAAIYKAENQHKANVYGLVPGKGVHHPVLAPHCYKNGNSHSIALGIHFCLRSYDLVSRVYQVNYFLRKLGFNPVAPGKSALQDRLKIFLIGMFSKRNPTNKFELMDSGVARIRSFLRLLKKFARKGS
jgi:hypothetical protein